MKPRRIKWSFLTLKSHSWIIIPYNIWWSFSLPSTFHVLFALTLTTTSQDQLGYYCPFTGQKRETERDREFNPVIQLTFAEDQLRLGTALCDALRIEYQRLSPFLPHLWGVERDTEVWWKPVVCPHQPSAIHLCSAAPWRPLSLGTIMCGLKRAPTIFVFYPWRYLNPQVFQNLAKN